MRYRNPVKIDYMKRAIIGLVLFVVVLIVLLSCVFFAMIILEPRSREHPVVEGVTPIKEYLPFSFSDNDVITAKCQCRSLTNERIPGPNAYASEGFLVFREGFTIDPQHCKDEYTEDGVKEFLTDSYGKAIPIFNEIKMNGDEDNWKEISNLKSVPSKSVWVYYRESDRTLIFSIKHFN